MNTESPANETPSTNGATVAPLATTPAPAPAPVARTRAKRDPGAAAPKKNDPKLPKIATFFSQKDIQAALVAAVDRETDVVFAAKNAVLRLRGDSATRLRGLCAVDGEAAIVNEIKRQLNASGGPDIDSSVAITNPTAVIGWAVAKLLLETNAGGQFDIAFGK